ncbi:phosphatidylglycerophosphatase B [Pragia fontium]|uniref:undecaprenyl-diphosphate phosphatase n=1 Tax=Pragia fontium DSM 5563 = ATCC 49100 TaxID=1122977 RepID=A0AAJ5BGK8_9GAMM|nr:phosphatidylglycerophosphatase B [Pragia fontium]AKJ42076.1 phosphatidylglycerophosphatase [Pragia fontium]SFC47851.1 phosphatidylglycerophosphatase B [Pragia fontium DSM 5563 = ATCC 49100]SUB82312.1 Phosphatidylglycerophosphatase B [Pragia fontium]VEJ55152.1 Phosphatidylglycerophosphatase B [Pragia fontium]
MLSNSFTKWIVYGALILLTMPLVVWFCDWLWTPNEDNPLLIVLFWATETASSPWGAITSAILALWFVWRMQLPVKRGIALIAILAVAIVGGQVVKSIVKETVEEPRPFVLWLEDEYQVDDQFFYSLPRKERAKIVEQHLKGQKRVPAWLSKHWEQETGYSFPSGHTLFTATWALLGMGMLVPRRRYISAAVLMIWAVTVAGSRLLLGMHWPEDLIVSILLSVICAFWACWSAERWIFSSPEISPILLKKCEE